MEYCRACDALHEPPKCKVKYNARKLGGRHAKSKNAALKAAGMACAECGKRFDRCDLVLDHIKPVIDGGAEHDPANHQILCVFCHRRKTREESIWRAKNRG